jgi:hypothetical protein
VNGAGDYLGRGTQQILADRKVLSDGLTAVAHLAALREREVDMANKKSGKRGSGIIALIAVIAAFAAAPSAASANSGELEAPLSAPTVLPMFDYWSSFEASWAE